jgi:hypothetical protein
MKKILIYTVHKAASMFLHKIANDVSEFLGITHYSLNHHKGYCGVIRQSSWKHFIESTIGGDCFGPIRSGVAEPIFPDNLSEHSIILHLRDPRDVLTSLFFSEAYAHVKNKNCFHPSDEKRNKWEKDGIDLFVTERIDRYKERFHHLTSTLLGRENVVFVTYEEMLSDFSHWLDRFLSAFTHYDSVLHNGDQFPKSFSEIHRILQKQYSSEFSVISENVFNHKRQITPGDHKRKLRSETIDRLNMEFEQTLTLLDRFRC